MLRSTSMSQTRLITVEPVLFGFMLALFISFPIQEQLVYKKVCNENFNDTVCNNIRHKTYKSEENYVQAHTSTWMLYIRIATTLPSMFAALMLGPCSDKIGRKFVMILPLIGSCIEAIAMVLNAYYTDLPVVYMLIGVTVSGFFGNFALILMAVFSYISDITTEKNRTLRVSILESMIFISGCLGELLGGVMVENVGYYITFCVVFGIYALNLLYVLIFVNESYFPEKKATFSEVICTCKDSVNSIKIFAKKRAKQQQIVLILLLLSFFCTLLVFTGSTTVRVLFALHPPLSFSSSMVGYCLAVSMLYRGIGVLIGAPLFIHFFKFGDHAMIIIGCCGTMLMYIALGFASKAWMMFTIPLLDSLGGIVVPCIRSIMSKNVAKNEQGTLFSAIASVEVFCTLIASLTLNPIYSATVSWYPGFTFFVMSLVLILPIFVSWYLRRKDASSQYKTFETVHEPDESAANQTS